MQVLLFTMLYLNTKHFGLRFGAVHRQLAFCYFHVVENAVICNLPAHIFSEHDSITTLHLDVNEDQIERCPVRLFKAYISNWYVFGHKFNCFMLVFAFWIDLVLFTFE